MRLTDREIAGQLAMLRGIRPRTQLLRPCSVGDGILVFDESRQHELVRRFELEVRHRKPEKYVTASGAASRMFRELSSRPEGCSQRVGHNSPGELSDAVRTFIERLPEFAFYGQLKDELARRGDSIEDLRRTGRIAKLISALLDKDGLGYAHLPKGLVAFHGYPDGPRTALEEHLVEARSYARGMDGRVRVHFTVRPEHQRQFENHINEARNRFDLTGETWRIETSVQDEATNTIALDETGEPLCDPSGALVLRPSGHGALLSNLNRLAGDPIFVRTIDNVFPDQIKPAIVHYKKVLAGFFFELQERIRRHLTCLRQGIPNSGLLSETETLVRDELCCLLPQDYDSTPASQKADYLFRLLHRPLRVCGMVPHIGKPGGGPFWVNGRDGIPALRIVEECEVDRESPDQLEIWRTAGFFNPVDIVCGIYDDRDEKFVLERFRDAGSYFVVNRQTNGQAIRMLEQPGLWNGGMAYWNSVFVAVPASTVRPVKTVLDLLNLSQASSS